MSASIISALAYCAREWAASNMERMFFNGCPRLRKMQRRDEFLGDCFQAASGAVIPRGRGYGIALWTTHELSSPILDKGAFIRLAWDRLDVAAIELGRELDRWLHGNGSEPGDYCDAVARAVQTGRVGVALNGIATVDAGDEFLHLGKLPHLRDDDAVIVRPWDVDAVFAVIRFFGNCVPGQP
jgi:hypothetical protein